MIVLKHDMNIQFAMNMTPAMNQALYLVDGPPVSCICFTISFIGCTGKQVLDS